MNCPHCKLSEEYDTPKKVVKSGIIRGLQRYYCNNCKKYFTEKRNDIIQNRKQHQTTIIDIANYLGIAPSTVSRALNDKSDINIETKKLIVKTASELDYKPNLLAKSLNLGNTHTIGVVLPTIERPFFAKVLAGIHSVTSNAGYRVIICQSNENHQTEILNIQTLIASQVDGLLISHTKETRSFDHLLVHLRRGIPVVHFDRVSKETNTPRVIHQNQEGSCKLVEHLLENGCKRIAVLAGPKGLLISENRLKGYYKALKKFGIKIDEDLIYYSNFQIEDPIKALDYWLSLQNPPDAIFAVFYLNAIEMMVEAKKRQLKIPEELAFVGFGDDLIAELFEPSLTVFHLFPFTMGEKAATILLENILIKNQHAPRNFTIKGKLIIRNSSLKNVNK